MTNVQEVRESPGEIKKKKAVSDTKGPKILRTGYVGDLLTKAGR